MLTFGLNLKINVPFQFSDHNYTSMVELDGNIVGANSNGIFELGKVDLDHESPINAFFK